ncbi:MAG: L,D-transpeptidase family protein [Clostridiaceae bacterium]|nr:L,D-transpeptidase family protein [Clostridiaceae bacterium]
MTRVLLSKIKIKKVLLFGLALIMLIIASIAADIMSLGTAKVYAASGTQPYIRYLVQRGDSLYKISRIYGTSISTIKSRNNLHSDLILTGQTLTIPVAANRSLSQIINANGLTEGQLRLNLVIDKSDKLLTIYQKTTPLKAYHVELGDGGTGDKQIAGDHKTPEGTFYITQKLVLSPADEYLGSRWMRLSYPNIEDASRGLSNGLINKSTYNSIYDAIINGKTPPQNTTLGGGVGIHGGSIDSFGSDWTWGCTGLTNRDVEDFYKYMFVGTKVVIQK